MKTKKPTLKAGIGPATTKTNFGHSLPPLRSQAAPALTSKDLSKLEARLAKAIAALGERIQNQLESMAKTLEEILADVAAEDTHEESTQTLLDGVRQQVTDALAGVDLHDEAQAKLDKVFTDLETHNEKVSSALTGDEPGSVSP